MENIVINLQRSMFSPFIINFSYLICIIQDFKCGYMVHIWSPEVALNLNTFCLSSSLNFETLAGKLTGVRCKARNIEKESGRWVFKIRSSCWNLTIYSFSIFLLSREQKWRHTSKVLQTILVISNIFHIIMVITGEDYGTLQCPLLVLILPTT